MKWLIDDKLVNKCSYCGTPQEFMRNDLCDNCRDEIYREMNELQNHFADNDYDKDKFQLTVADWIENQ